ncbi:MAG: hypothetical protein A2046_08860 [Bacteroidetes bacterium GWA2_30_7]|nr:MAG: hypothetical protein A2046_08860 [Bacteroidetes bacterium GWA2_30_7]
MKKIILVRHAKAEDSVTTTDKERSLVMKGKKQAQFVAEKIKKSVKPDLIITSSAFRALETAIIFATEMDYPHNKILLDEKLYYNYDKYYLIELINNYKNIDTVFIFGHNMTISEIALDLAVGYNKSMQKSEAVGIKFNISDWNDVLKTNGELFINQLPQ